METDEAEVNFYSLLYNTSVHNALLPHSVYPKKMQTNPERHNTKNKREQQQQQ